MLRKLPDCDGKCYVTSRGQSVLGVWMISIGSRARPVRVAYLVEETAKSSLILEAIFQHCYGLWGGRFHLIVPCVNGRPSDDFARWLEHYDPDIIYSYVDMGEAEISHIHEKYYPSFLVGHRILKSDISVRDFRPQLPFSPLTVETVLPISVGPSMHEIQNAEQIIEDFKGRAADDDFGKANFGEFLGATGRSFPRYLHQYAAPVQILADDDLQPRKRYALQNISTLPDSTEVVRRLTRGRVLTVAMLSATQAPRLDIPNSAWANAFSIVVGNSFVDRITFWNARSLYPRWRDGQHVDLVVPEESLSDVGLLEAISEFLLWRNHVDGAAQSGSPRVVLRSSSVAPQRLEEFASLLRQKRGIYLVDVQTINSVSGHVPSVSDLERSRLAFASGIGSAALQNWQRAEVTNSPFSMRAARPDHLRYCPPALVAPHAGAWACDLAIGRANDLSLYENVDQTWMLPRRLRLASAFRKSYQLSNGGAFVAPRVVLDGYLCLFSDTDTSLGPVELPGDHEAICLAYTAGRDWWPFSGRHDGDRLPAQIAYHAERSGNGRYFHGLLDMFGGVKNAQAVLLHEYWQLQFANLGASYTRAEHRQEKLASLLRKKFRTKLDQELSGSIDAISDEMVRYSDTNKGRLPRIDWTSMQRDHESFIKRYWEEHPARDDEGDVEEWVRSQRDSLEASVQALCRIGILHQGYESKCRKCLHRTWVPVDKLKPIIVCEICRTETAAPIARSWEFRISEFVREALRSQGVLPLFWALSRSRHMQEQCFYFDGPLDLYFTPEGYRKHHVDTDVDLTIVRDGKVEIVEAKSSVRHLSAAIDFAEVAKRVRPDIATIAVMEESSPKTVAIFKSYVEALSGSGIEPRLLTLRPDRDLARDPSMSSYQSYRVF